MMGPAPDVVPEGGTRWKPGCRTLWRSLGNAGTVSSRGRRSRLSKEEPVRDRGRASRQHNAGSVSLPSASTRSWASHGTSLGGGQRSLLRTGMEVNLPSQPRCGWGPCLHYPNLLEVPGGGPRPRRQRRTLDVLRDAVPRRGAAHFLFGRDLPRQAEGHLKEALSAREAIRLLINCIGCLNARDWHSIEFPPPPSAGSFLRNPVALVSQSSALGRARRRSGNLGFSICKQQVDLGTLERSKSFLARGWAPARRDDYRRRPGRRLVGLAAPHELGRSAHPPQALVSGLAKAALPTRLLLTGG